MHKKEECQAANPATCRNHGTVQPDDFIAKLTKKKSKIQPLEKGLNDLATVNPVLAAEWHPTLNGNLTPEDYKAISAHSVWWQCSADSNHVWKNRITHRNTGHGCPQCGPAKLEQGVNDLATVNPALAAEWHPTKNGKLTPEDVKTSSRKKVWWLGKCGHEFAQIIGDRNAGNGCPTCSGRVLLTGLNDLATINPEAAKDWHPTLNGKLTPQDVRANEGRLVWWQCPVKSHHTWEAMVSSRNYGTLCPHCPHKTSKAEDTVREYIESLNYEVQSSNRKVLKGKEIDIYIPSLKVGIEFNGVYWHSEGGGKKDTQYHYNKWSNCGKVGVELIQIWEDDWVANPELVLKSLSRRLGAKSDSDSAANLTTQSISEDEAESFLKSNDLTGFKAGSHYHGSVDVNGDLKSVFSLEKVGESKMNIVQYISNTDVNGDLKELLQHAKETHGVTSFTVTVDNCSGEGSIYKNAGFVETKVEPADYKYLVRGKRISSSTYTPEKFRDDPALEWEDGLTEKELADLNGLNRIWDAGKTTYEFNII